MEVTADSGAVTTVGPKNTCTAFPLEETVASRAGKHFTGANGSPIRNYGVRKVKAVTSKEGREIKMPIQVADVMKVLASVGQMIHSGNRVVFDEAGSYIENKKSGKRTEMKEKHGNFVFEMRVPKKGNSGFHRQVATVQTLTEQL